MSEFMTPQEVKDSNKKNNWLIALVILLILLLTAQSVAVIYYLTRKEPSSTEGQALHSAGPGPAGYPGAAVQRSRKVSGSPYTRQFHQTYDPLFADAMDSMSRLEDHFNRMVGQMMASAPDMTDLFGGADDFDFMPTVDLEETADGYVVKVDLPGLDKDKINITVRDEVLTIQGVRQSETHTSDDKSGVFKQERSYGTFSRSLRLPGPVDDSKIAADYKNGVLTIKLPKLATAEAEARKIAIQ